MEANGKKQCVAVVGAGPAGLFAAKELADHGVHVALLNRDIKPGGLAEYGIYPDKYKMKSGLRRSSARLWGRQRLSTLAMSPSVSMGI